MQKLAFVLWTLFTGAVCHAQTATNPPEWPTKPIRWIVPFPAGSATDVAARLVTQKLAQSFGQPQIVENRAGASTTIGGQLLAQSAADGYTFIIGGNSTFVIAPLLMSNVGYEPLRDFTPVGMVGTGPYALLVSPSVQATNVKELIALANARPGILNYASAGTGSLAHLAGELFARTVGVKLTHVPYKSSAQSMMDVSNGRVEILFGTLAPTAPLIRAGKLRALAVTGSTRYPSFPDLPTVAEAGVQEFEVSFWTGIFGPIGLPAAIAGRVNRELNAHLVTTEMKDALLAQGFQTTVMTPDQVGAFLKVDIAKWSVVIKGAGINVDTL